MKAVRWLVTVVVAVLLVIFAVSNRQPVEVTFWPLPIAIETRLFLVVLLAMLIGFLIGEFVAWLGGRRWRQEARHKSRRIAALERELSTTQAQLKSEAPAPSAGTIAPPGRTLPPLTGGR